MAKKIRWSMKAASNFEEICNYIAKGEFIEIVTISHGSKPLENIL